MELKRLYEHLEREVTYPIDVEAVRRDVGATEVDAPDREDTETIAQLLEAVDEETYGSATELFESILSRLPDEYVGRKYYDDRGVNVSETDRGPTDEKHRSF